jgi:hypothetical protein
MSGFWTPERRETVKAMRWAGIPNAVIAAHFGISRGAMSGIVYRLGLTKTRYVKGPRKAREPQPSGAMHRFRGNILPSEAPFAPDGSCPDFAWDEAHCGAVIERGGFPILPARRLA